MNHPRTQTPLYQAGYALPEPQWPKPVLESKVHEVQNPKAARLSFHLQLTASAESLLSHHGGAIVLETEELLLWTPFRWWDLSLDPNEM